MKHLQRTTILALASALLIPAFAAAVEPQQAPNVSLWIGSCNPAGTWLGTTRTSGTPSIATVVKAQHGTFSSLGTSIADDPSFGGALPAVAASPNRGVMRKTGRLTYAGTGIRYGWGADLALVWIERSETVVEFGSQCDSVAVEGLYHYYGPWQDPFGDEPPAYGTYPGGADYERLPG